MKKTACLIMAGVMALSVGGCGSSSTKTEKTTTAKEAVQETTTVIVETTIEETTKKETTTKEKENDIAQPSQVSNCETPEEAIQPVCDGFMNGDIDEMFSTFPIDLKENKNFKAVKGQLKDVLKQLSEFKEQGLVYEISVKNVEEPETTNLDTLNKQYAAMGVDYKITDIKKVDLSVTISLDGQSTSQDVMKCVAGKIGKYWYFVSVEQ